MRALILFLAVVMILPRPVSEYEPEGASGVCACSCCPGQSDCGCQADLRPAAQSLAVLPFGIFMHSPSRKFFRLMPEDFLYTFRMIRSVFHPPNVIAYTYPEKSEVKLF